ncbi:MAG: enoyl-CoA hydratase/isomerase family protein [Ignavibacteriae bacterium]|nr:enoyl-CoA hydratase/isomerase family protein [Ignavibacteria bacterium]MBI3365548.1 enoyl-CoA hydratase/isomerase family protein [Ignavibacteriota bacterium]
MPYSAITYSVEQRSALITLNRPERRNALDDVMIRELTEVFTLLNRNTQARTVILTGSGSSFCSGMDLDYLQRFSQLGQQENLEDAHSFLRLLLLIHNLKKPVIAMVNGPALGGGCGIAAACDFVYAAREKAKVGVPEVRLGFVPAVILVFLIKRMGEGAARECVLRGDILNAATAKDRRLVTEVVDDDKLSSAVFAFAEELARTTSSSSIALTKDLFMRFDEMEAKDAVDYAAQLNALARKTDDFRKGIDSFLNKEKLEW